MRTAVLSLGTLVLGLGACSVETAVTTLPPPAPHPLACDVMVDEPLDAVMGQVSSWGARIAVSGDGSVYVAWGQEGFRAARRTPDGTWSRIGGAAAGAPSQQLSLFGTPDGAVALLVAQDHEVSTLWRYRAGDWQLLLETLSDSRGNQNDGNAAVGADGALHFALNVKRDDDMELELLSLGPKADAPVSHGPLGGGRDPMVAVDPFGARHVVFNDEGNSESMVYLGPDGARRRLPAADSGWPSLAASPDGLVMFGPGGSTHVDGREVPEHPRLWVSRDGERWARFTALDRVLEACPDLGPWAHDQIGTTCQHHVYRDGRHLLLGGPRTLLLLHELHEQGTKVWGCSDQGEQMCSWRGSEGYTVTHRLLIGRVTRGGTALGPVAVPLAGSPSHGAGIHAAQDGQGQVHLLLTEPDGDVDRHRYMRLGCREVMP